ncbi:MAG TPA: hypothetical protein VEX86_18380 [Longimicrobium sp.]|nr:hypothetical protein [Longimicrobium sp.]
MKKLVLNVEALEVETFEADASEEKPGAVAAHELTPAGCPLPSYDPHDAYCVLQSPDGGYAPCTPVCYTYAYYCTDNPDAC